MRKLFNFFIIFLLITFCSFGQKDTLQKKIDSISLTNKNTNTIFYEPTKKSPFVFLDSVIQYENGGRLFDNVVILMHDFPLDWVKRGDIDSLIQILKSKRKCKCFFNIVFSGVPEDNDFAELGGYAIEFINSYRQKRKVDFGLYSCPKTDNNEINEILDWWNNYKKK
ncbi:MAG: hypothetical protein PHD97_11380 [Bacteroidales bacterium]|nr:hypothetical protein [Bacteroidales bacterium]